MWNYRLVRFKNEVGRGYHYSLQEVYYDDKGKPYGCCDASIVGPSIKDCNQDLKWITRGMKKPPLNYPKDFVKSGASNDK